jgi:ribonuclease BN (tRNA processing enzyme)
MRLSRRNILAALAMAPVANSGFAAVPSLGPDRLVLLGTKGGPRIASYIPSPSANLVIYRNVPYVVDAGYGATFKLVESGFPLPQLRYIFITHNHSDHNLDLGPLVYNAWAAGLKTPVDIYGPEGVRDVVDGFWAANHFDIETRVADEGRPDLRKLISSHVYHDGIVLQTGDVRISALRNKHPPIVESYALKFELGRKTIVFSGDTSYFPPLAAFARGADFLVHEVLYGPAIDKALEPNATRLMQHLHASHTRAEDVGRIAQAAQVKNLVLNHFVPGDDRSITAAMWKAAVRKTFNGNIIVGRDLLEIPLS